MDLKPGETRPFQLHKQLYKKNCVLESKFKHAARQILAHCFIRESSEFEDTKEATDFVCKGSRIAFRVRSNYYLYRYKDEFTVRSSILSGTKTEIDKILGGYCDYMLYSFSNKEETRLESWRVIDLDVFRKEYPNIQNRIVEHQNQDQYTRFVAFKISWFSQSIVYADSVQGIIDRREVVIKNAQIATKSHVQSTLF